MTDRTPPQIIWDLAGRPFVDHAVEQVQTCLVCGAEAEWVLPSKKAIPRTDTDRDQFEAPWSEWVCAGCRWTSKGRPPNTMRLWSVLYRADGFGETPSFFADYMAEKLPGYREKERTLDVAALLDAGDALCLTNKADPRPIVRLLCDPPETAPYFAAIADSGQIHVLRFARLNRGRRWTVRFERDDVECDASDFARVVWHAASLKAAGVRDDEIRTGTPSTHTLMNVGMELWLTHMKPLAVWTTTAVLDLALFCCTKEHTDAHIEFTEPLVGSKYRDDALERGRRSADRMPFTQPERRPEKDVVDRPEGAPGGGGAGDDVRADGVGDARPDDGPRSALQQDGLQQDLFAGGDS